MLKTTRTIAMLVAAIAVLAVPATAVAAKGGKGKANSCEKKTPSVGYQVSGTLVSATPADDPNTPASESAVTLLVTNANSHARNSGEITDMDPNADGVQVKGATYTVPAGDFVLKLNGYEDTDTPSEGDKVKVSGRIPVTKKRCAAEGADADARYGTPDIRRVTISDRDEDVVPV